MAFKLQGTLKNYLWGGHKLETLFGRYNGGDRVSESWEVSVHPDGESRTGDGRTLARILQEEPALIAPGGGEFPVLIKYIDAHQKLSLQVHPSDGFARRVEGDNGKTEMWYILSAEEGAGIYCGFRRAVTKEEFLARVKEGTVEELLNFIPVRAGDCYLIEAGTVHAIGAGCVICEVQQSSNVTYRVYDYNRRDDKGNLRPLHVEKAIQVINFDGYHDRTNRGAWEQTSGGKIRKLTSCRYFRCRELLLRGTFRERNDGSYTAVCALEGEGTLNGLAFAAGDSFFVPCGEALEIKGKGKFILTDSPKHRYFAGIDLGGTYIKVGIADEEGRLLKKTSIPTAHERHYGEIAADMASAVARLAEELAIAPEEIEAAGIGSPGVIDSERGTVVYSNNLAWKEVPLGEAVGKILKKPVFVTNDANAAALGENACGAGSKYRSVILVTLGTGVGGGIVLDGTLFEGGKSAGAEIGHTVIKAGGERCTCGRRGCFEAYASATALIRDTKRAMEKHPESAMWQIAGGLAAVDGKTAFDGMRAGDPAAKRVVSAYLRMLATGLVNLANEFRPDIILLGGGVSKEGEALLKPLRRIFNRELFGGTKYAPVRLGVAALGNDAGMCGAAEYAKAKVSPKSTGKNS